MASIKAEIDWTRRRSESTQLFGPPSQPDSVCRQPEVIQKRASRKLADDECKKLQLSFTAAFTLKSTVELLGTDLVSAVLRQLKCALYFSCFYLQLPYFN